MNKKALIGMILLILSLILAACGGSDDTNNDNDTTADTSPQPAPTAIPTFDDASPEAVVVAFLAACEIGDLASMLDLLTEEMQQLAIVYGSTSCDEESAIKEANGSHLATEIVGKTAYVDWQWIWPDGSEMHYRHTLSNTDDGVWRLFGFETIYREKAEENSADAPTPTASVNVVTNVDTALLEGVSYVSQIGIAGQSDTVIIAGSMSRAEFMNEAKAFAESYFALYQAGDFAALSGLAYANDIENFDIAMANDTVEMEIVEVDVDAATNIMVYAPSSIDRSSRPEPPKDNSLPNSPFVETPIIEVNMPVFVRFTALGQTWTDDVDLAVLYRPETQTWELRYWGILTAVGQQAVQNRDDYEVQINGLALMHNATLVTMAVTRPLPSDLLWMDTVVYDDLNARPGASSRVEFDENTNVGYVKAQGFDHRAVNAIVWFRMSPRGILGFYDDEISVVLP